ncbi:hypothetical protein [Rhizobium sp. CF080]|uniref:hypothetical protein n=1 Tax=Rhizobium sp. (strain CF080) TaxID=1144310 RepID=UPI0012DE759E|nr:hypothetical protein [Rhizobium sp. CF080]
MNKRAEKATQSFLWQKPVLVRTGDEFFESINGPSGAGFPAQPLAWRKWSDPRKRKICL